MRGFESFKRSDALGGRTRTGNFAEQAEKEMNEDMLQEHAACVEKYTETAATILNWLKALDLKEVGNIFSEYLTKSGIPVEHWNVAEKFYLYEGVGDNEMAYNSASNAIRINVKYYDELLLRYDEDEVFVRFMHALFHETAHSTSYNKIEWDVEFGETNMRADLKQQTGFDANVASKRIDNGRKSDEQMRVFELFNEGITEQIAHEVVLEYVRRRPTSIEPSKFKRTTTNYLESEIFEGTNDYDAARQMITAIVLSISEQTNVPEKVVWRGFVRQYYTGEMTPGDVVELLNETFGSNFGERIAEAKDGTDLRELALSLRSLSTHYPDVAQKWLDHLHVTRGAQ
ncbi:MAG: hypothetical protein JO019_03710 [Candidatus Kaiserbacteria bacterium]|nr:hypothetical protein [Candidatus Kaiserbacteria bacterium]